MADGVVVGPIGEVKLMISIWHPITAIKGRRRSNSLVEDGCRGLSLKLHDLPSWQGSSTLSESPRRCSGVSGSSKVRRYGCCQSPKKTRRDERKGGWYVG